MKQWILFFLLSYTENKESQYGSMKRLWILVMIITFSLPASIASRYAAVLMEPYSGRMVDGVFYQRKVFPASLTKMMTLFLLFDALVRKKVSLGTQFVASHYASLQPSAKWGVRLGHRLSVRECILTLALRSCNDVAVLVGENLSGSISKFVQKMNEMAQRLGLQHTHFCNPSGLHHPLHQTTAKDMALLIRALWLHFPQYSCFLGMPSFQLHRKMYHNTNKLQGKVLGMKMGKTGYTCPAGWNLATLTVRNQSPVIVVVMGMPSSKKRNAHVAQLIQSFYQDPGQIHNILLHPSSIRPWIQMKRVAGRS